MIADTFLFVVGTTLQWIVFLSIHFLQMERTYKAKYELLTEKERHATEKLQKSQEVGIYLFFQRCRKHINY